LSAEEKYDEIETTLSVYLSFKSHIGANCWSC